MMKTIKITTLIFWIMCSIGSLVAQDTLMLTPTARGSEGDTRYTDSSPLELNYTGEFVALGDVDYLDWEVEGSSSISELYGRPFSVEFQGMKTTTTVLGANYGKMLTEGGIDRSNSGYLGVRGTTNGIDFNEGFTFGFDLSQLDSFVVFKLLSVSVIFIADAEAGVIVNRNNTSHTLTFGAPGTGADVELTEGDIDVSLLDIYLTGGEVDADLFSVFNTAASGSYRVVGMNFEVINTGISPSLVLGHDAIAALSHPRLLLSAGEEEEIKQLINQSEEFKDIHDFILQQSDDFLSYPPIVRSLTADGRLLAISRDAIMRVFYLSYAYRMTDEEKYLVGAEVVLKAISAFSDWNPSQSLDCSEMIMAAAIGYDWLYNDLSAQTLEEVRDAIYTLGLLTTPGRPFWDMESNWNQVCIGGSLYGALAIYKDGTNDMDRAADYVIDQVLEKNQPTMNLYGDGNYAEGPMYWSYGTTYEVLMLSQLERLYGKSHQGLNQLTNTPGFLQSAEYMMYVSGTSMLNFNYSDATEPQSPLFAAFWMANRLNNNDVLYLQMKMMEDGLFFKNGGEDRFLPMTLIHGKDIQIGELSAPEPQVWTGNGPQPVVLVRTGWEGSLGHYLGVKGGTPNHSHAHMDAGTFVYDAQGQRWASDLGKYDYEALRLNISGNSDKSQDSERWDIFRLNNKNHNTLSIKKSSESEWQRHVANGVATIDEVYDTEQKKGALINLTDILGLNDELDLATREITLQEDAFLMVKDSLVNGEEAIDVYWNMITSALVEIIDANTMQLKQGGKTALLQFSSSNPLVTFQLEDNRSTDPVDYFPTHTYERKNEGKIMIGFTASIPAGETVVLTTTLIDGEDVPPSVSVSDNSILLDIPEPMTGVDCNTCYTEQSRFDIDAFGKVFISGFSNKYPWLPYGTILYPEAVNTHFYMAWKAMATVEFTEGDDYGALLTPAGIDRSSDGQLGVRGGDGNGIDIGEGFILALDLTPLPSTLELQLTKIKLNYIGGEEAGMIVNRMETSKRLSFGAPGTGTDVSLTSGFVDVTQLDIIVKGGEIMEDVISIFNTNASGSYRITGYEFKMLQNNSSNIVTYLVDTTNNPLRIYPNPFTHQFTLAYDNEEVSSINITLSDMSGNEVWSAYFEHQGGEQALTIIPQDLPPGIYFCSLLSNDNKQVCKIIKQ